MHQRLPVTPLAGGLAFARFASLAVFLASCELDSPLVIVVTSHLGPERVLALEKTESDRRFDVPKSARAQVRRLLQQHPQNREEPVVT